MPQIQLERLRPQDVDLERGRVYLQPRKKGHGVPGAWVSLIPQAVEALRDFAAADLFGKVFSRPSMAKTWTRAIENTYRDLGKTDPAKLTQLQQCLPEGCRPYDLRHSFLTEFYRQTGDIRATAEMGQHADLETTKKYTEGAVSERVAAGVAKMAAAAAAPQAADEAGDAHPPAGEEAMTTRAYGVCLVPRMECWPRRERLPWPRGFQPRVPTGILECGKFLAIPSTRFQGSNRQALLSGCGSKSVDFLNVLWRPRAELNR